MNRNGIRYESWIDQVVVVPERIRPAPDAQRRFVAPGDLLYVRGWISAPDTLSAIVRIGPNQAIAKRGLPRPDLELLHPRSGGFEAFIEVPSTDADRLDVTLAVLDHDRVTDLTAVSLCLGDPRPRTSLTWGLGLVASIDEIRCGVETCDTRLGLEFDDDVILMFRGWAIQAQPRRAGVALYAARDDRELYPLGYGYPRYDVAIQQHDAAIVSCGFIGIIHTRAIGLGEHTLRLVLVLEDGGAIGGDDVVRLSIKHRPPSEDADRYRLMMPRIE